MFYNVTELKISHANSPIHKAVLENKPMDVLNLHSANAGDIATSMDYVPRILDQQSEEGLTPLQLASIIGDQSMFDLLVDIGANINYHNLSSPHHSPYDIAKSLANNYRSKANKIESEKSAGFEYLDCKEYQEANKQARDHEILINYLDKIIPAELKNIDYPPVIKPIKLKEDQFVVEEAKKLIEYLTSTIQAGLINKDVSSEPTKLAKLIIKEPLNKASDAVKLPSF